MGNIWQPCSKGYSALLMLSTDLSYSWLSPLMSSPQTLSVWLLRKCNMMDIVNEATKDSRQVPLIYLYCFSLDMMRLPDFLQSPSLLPICILSFFCAKRTPPKAYSASCSSSLDLDGRGERPWVESVSFETIQPVPRVLQMP